MVAYRLDLFLAPSGRLGDRREIQASDDADAVGQADLIFEGLVAHVLLDRYVLYDHMRVVHERRSRRIN
jgi:hypothetical protein